MPLRANVGVSRKVADNNYGSRGASVNLEVELESALVNEPERFFDRIRQVFRLAQQSIDEELTRQQNNSTAGHATNGATHGHAAQPSHCGNGQHTNGKPRSNGRKATASQVRALHAIANRQGFDLAETLQEGFGTGRPEDLSITEASQLIDTLKAAGSHISYSAA